MIYATHIDREAPLASVLRDLRRIGAVSQPFRRNPWYRLLEADNSAHDAISAVDGVAGCCDCHMPVMVHPPTLALDQPAAGGLWPLAAISNTPGVYSADADGAGVVITTVDVPGNFALAEFGGRASLRYNPSGGFGLHGTAMAACAIGEIHGVAKGATLRAFAGFNADGSSTVQEVNAAIDAQTSDIEDDPPPGAVVASYSFNTAGINVADVHRAVIDRLASLGVPIVASSGNNASLLSTAVFGFRSWPCMHAAVIGVGGHNESSEWYPIGNWGEGVAIHAPGWDLELIDQNGHPFTGSGTSPAAQYVAGAMACAAQAGKIDLRAWVLAQARLGVMTGIPSGADGVLFKPALLLSPQASDGLHDWDGGDAFTEAYIFDADGGDASTVYNPLNDLQDS